MPFIENIHAFQGREQFVVTLRCKCSQQGTAIWEESVAPAPRGPQPVLLEVSSGFYLRRKRDRGVSEIACAVCETILGFSRTRPVTIRALPPIR
ncbi:MAG TPA: hypothetical protein VGM68_08820 [Rhizomicrobium sp.]|jgi:hypothetical protein